MAKKNEIEKKVTEFKTDLTPEACEHRIKLLQNHVKKIEFLIENEPYEDEHKFLNRMLKIRFEEIDHLKKFKKVNLEIINLEKKLNELKREKEKMKK